MRGGVARLQPQRLLELGAGLLHGAALDEGRGEVDAGRNALRRGGESPAELALGAGPVAGPGGAPAAQQRHELAGAHRVELVEQRVRRAGAGLPGEREVLAGARLVPHAAVGEGERVVQPVGGRQRGERRLERLRRLRVPPLREQRLPERGERAGVSRREQGRLARRRSASALRPAASSTSERATRAGG